MIEQENNGLPALTAARAKAVAWLLARIDRDGRPLGSELANGWSRLPWTLAIAGETHAAARVLEWAVREGLDLDGQFRSGPARGAGPFIPYWMGHLAMGAALLERYDIAARVLDRLKEMQDPFGGLPIDPLGGALAHISEMTLTAQAGLAALLAGRQAMATGVRDWLFECLQAQPELPRRLYVGRSGAKLVTEPPAGVAWLLTVNFDTPRQAYYHSGIAAAFLGAYAMRTGDKHALAAGHRYLGLNISGIDAQFTDQASVQICKFGWGAAVMQVADPNVSYRPHILRMCDWFVSRQAADGSWAPSSFLSPSPTVPEFMMKTAEHAMEVSALMSALAVLDVRGHGPVTG